MVKLTLDQLVVKYMPFNMNNATAKEPILKIVLGEFEVTTSSFEKAGTGKNDFIFPETFELQVDINAYRDGELMLHVEIYDQVNDEFVYIGNGTSPLIGLINLSTVNQSVGFSVDIDPYEPKLSRERTCVIEMSGRIDYQENEYLTDELSLKQAEMDALQVKFDEFVSGSKAMEVEMDDALQAAQQKVLKLSKKNGDLTEKYNELTETYNSLQSAYEELNEQLNNLQSVTVATETYNELTETYNSLTTEYERMQTELQEAVVERSNVEADYTNRYNELTETYNNLVTEYETLQEQYEQAVREKDDSGKKEEENAGLVEQYNSLTEVYNSLTEEYERVTEESQQLKGELQRRIDNDSSINNYEQLIADLEGKVRDLSSSRDKLGINLQQSEKDKSMLTTDNNSLKSQLKEAIEQKNATIKALDEEKQRLESTTGDASQLRSQLSTKIASLEEELQSDKRRIEELLVEKKRLEDLPPPPAPAPVVVVEAPPPAPIVQVVTQEVVNTTVVRPYITMTSTVFDTDFYQSLQNSSNAADRLVSSLVEAGDSERLKVALINSVQVYQDLKRRNLTNLYKLSKLRNTVHVCCRVRPLSDDELKDSSSNSSNSNSSNSNSCIIEIVSDQLLAVTKGSELIPFELDTVWGYDANQADVFEDVEPLIAAVASGCDASIISYGGSKAGKSFTMSGFGQHVGVFYRSILKLFDLLEFKKSQSSKNSIDFSIFGFSVELSVLCIQNEEITDLIALLESGKSKSSYKTKVKATLALAKSTGDGGQRGGPYEVIIPNKVVKTVSSAAEAMLLFTRAVQGISDRNSGYIEQNAHLILQINVKQYKDAKSPPFQSTVTLADLASIDDRYPPEHVSNQSITSMTNVLHTACSSSSSSIGSINSSTSSQLAIVLAPTLGGNAKSLVIINVCPSVHAIDKTLVDLQFASKLFSYSASQQQQQQGSSSKTISTTTTTTTASSLSSSILLTTSIQTVTLQQKLDTVSEELALTKEKCVMIEENFHKTRDAAKTLVQQLFDHSKLLVDKFQYEQEQNKVLSNNFELLSKNHQYTVSELQQQIAINEKLLATIKAAGFDN